MSSTPESRSNSVMAINAALLSLSSIFVLLRLATRIQLKRTSFKADDYVIITAWIFSLGFSIDVCMQTRYGLGKHLHDLPANTDFARSLELFYFGEVIYYTCVCLTKISILFLYMQLSPAYTFRCLVWGMMVFVGLTALGCTVAGLFQCDPIRKAWLTDLPGTCFNQTALFVSNAALNIAQDVIIYFLPVPMLWKLQLPLKQRVALILVFALGGFVVVTGIMRLQSLKFASVSSDPTWDNYGAAIWSCIEQNVGIMCACLVHFKSLIARYAPAMLGIARPEGSNRMRLPDGDYNGKKSGSAGLRTFGRSADSGRKIGILTELKIEEETCSSSQTNIVMPSTQVPGQQDLELTPRNPAYEIRRWVGEKEDDDDRRRREPGRGTDIQERDRLGHTANHRLQPGGIHSTVVTQGIVHFMRTVRDCRVS
ncbi:hypothetical protein P8C59_006072 [Phyllachora maydis]|uniref:Rhodopsin domain-containing protein n=1 Tax=Phyllachora maydis TaxID=1825666 RepID=A0AAD9I602_9PEZI|nr:hypothetical protein P8C59_006072 [Phyllachora maydis]